MNIFEERYNSGELFYCGGSLDELELFNRLYSLGELPSTDQQFSYANNGIQKHLIANDYCDWFYSHYIDNFEFLKLKYDKIKLQIYK